MMRLMLITCCFFLSSFCLSQEQKSYQELHDEWFSTLPQEVKQRMEMYKSFGIKREAFRYALAMEGISPEKLTTFKDIGIDLSVNLVNPGSTELYKYNAVLFECIAIGTIKKILYDTTNTSCFHTIAEVEVEKYMRASPQLRSAKTLNILLRSGPLSSDLRREVTHEFRPEQGVSYFLFLSNHTLRYSMAHQTKCYYQLTDTSFFASVTSPRIVGKEVWFLESDKKQPLVDFLRVIEETVDILTQ